MLRELYHLGLRLRENGEIPPPGFAEYAAPIAWTVALRLPEAPGGPPRATLREGGGDRWRADSGRTVNILAYPLADQGAYVFGRDVKNDGKTDNKAAVKRENFRQRLAEVAGEVEDADLADAIRLYSDALEQGVLDDDPKLVDIASDDWVSVQMMDGPLAGTHLFEHPEAMRWWAEWLDAEMRQKGGTGVCSITGEVGALVNRIPGTGYFRGKASLLGLNEDAYVSYLGGAGAAKKATLGVSYDAADVANRALGYLARSDRNRETLVYDKNSDLRTLTALFWLSEEVSIPVPPEQQGEIGEEVDVLALLGPVVNDYREEDSPKPTLGQAQALLQAVRQPRREALRMDETAFYLAVLSKNPPVRVVVREWLALDLGSVVRRMEMFLERTDTVLPDGGRSLPVSVNRMLAALEGAGPTNLARDLLLTAFAGRPLPPTALQAAVSRLRVAIVQGDAPTWQLHALAALLSLTLSTLHDMPGATRPRNPQARLCGQLLAVLERIQQDALTDDNRKGNRSLNRTLTQRVFASASTAPEAFLGPLVQRTTVAHVPKLLAPDAKRTPKDYSWGQVRANCEMETLMAQIDKAGGFPRTLDLHGQAEFALGFYHKRAEPSAADNLCAKKDTAPSISDTASDDA